MARVLIICWYLSNINIPPQKKDVHASPVIIGMCLFIIEASRTFSMWVIIDEIYD